jgi:hypothetical protein
MFNVLVPDGPNRFQRKDNAFVARFIEDHPDERSNLQVVYQRGADTITGEYHLPSTGYIARFGDWFMYSKQASSFVLYHKDGDRPNHRMVTSGMDQNGKTDAVNILKNHIAALGSVFSQRQDDEFVDAPEEQLQPRPTAFRPFPVRTGRREEAVHKPAMTDEKIERMIQNAVLAVTATVPQPTPPPKEDFKAQLEKEIERLKKEIEEKEIEALRKQIEDKKIEKLRKQLEEEDEIPPLQKGRVMKRITAPNHQEEDQVTLYGPRAPTIDPNIMVMAIAAVVIAVVAMMMFRPAYTPPAPPPQPDNTLSLYMINSERQRVDQERQRVDQERQRFEQERYHTNNRWAPHNWEPETQQRTEKVLANTVVVEPASGYWTGTMTYAVYVLLFIWFIWQCFKMLLNYYITCIKHEAYLRHQDE